MLSFLLRGVVKTVKRLKGSYCGITAGEGADNEPESRLRMSTILALDKYMKSLHCFPVVSLSK